LRTSAETPSEPAGGVHWIVSATEAFCASELIGRTPEPIEYQLEADNGVCSHTDRKPKALFVIETVRERDCPIES